MGTLENNIPLLYEVNDGDKVATCHIIYVFTSISCYMQDRTISYLAVPSASLLASSLSAYNLCSYNTVAKVEYKQKIHFNRTSRGDFSRRLPNQKKFIKRTLWFFNGCTKFNKKV